MPSVSARLTFENFAQFAISFCISICLGNRKDPNIKATVKLFEQGSSEWLACDKVSYYGNQWKRKGKTNDVWIRSSGTAQALLFSGNIKAR